MESQRLLPLNETQDEDSQEDDWIDDESSCNSDYSDSDSTIPDWEPYIDDVSGRLLYIDCLPFVIHNNKDEQNKLEVNKTEAFAKTQLRKSTRGKFLRLIRRRESKRRSKLGQKQIDENSELNTQKVTFQDFQEGEEKNVTLEIDSENRYNLSCDKTLAESLLGLIVSTLSDGNRVMIAGFSYDSKAKNERNIKIGDWLKSINNIDVNVQNLDDVLQKFINQNEVLLTLQRVAATEVTKDPPINELNLESDFVRELLSLKDDLLSQKLSSFPLGLVYLNTESSNENNGINDDIIYYYPKPIEQNILCNSRGMFLTLNHLIQDVTNMPSRSSSMLYKSQLVHIVYIRFDNNLLLYMLPDNLASIKETVLLSSELVRLLEFSFESVEKCFTSEIYANELDRFMSRYFMCIVNNNRCITTKKFMENLNASLTLDQSNCFFEDIMPIVPTLYLHDDAKMEVDDALAELEASDYREWNEEPLDCQRLFTILGSALFHSGYLLASHLIHEDLIDVYNFSKHNGLIHLSQTEPVKSLVMWREVFPLSCKSEQLNDLQKFPLSRRYLLVVGSGRDLLAVIMEAGGCTESAEENMGPDVFYVEEAQATLAHIQELGISVIAQRSLLANGGFEITIPTPVLNKKKNDFMGALHISKSNAQTLTKDSSQNAKKNEVTSILKRRSSEQSFPVTSVQCYESYDAYSEESASQNYSEKLSLASDESGSRNRRVRYDSNDEESDSEDFGGSSQFSTSSLDISEVRQTLLSDLGEYSSIQLTSGPQNVLYHFVHIDENDGILICPLECSLPSLTYGVIMNNFRKCCQNIHSVFQNTLRFKNMPSQDIAKTLINKSLIAVKEYGTLFDCAYIDDKENNKKNKICYWVIGRLFYMPHPRELYICYQDTIPQNIVELAFKINLYCNTH